MLGRKRKTPPPTGRGPAGVLHLAEVIAGLVETGYRFGRRVREKAPPHRLLHPFFGRRPTERRRNRFSAGIFGFAHFLLELIERLARHNVYAIAAQVAFYLFLATFPALAAFGFFFALLGDPARLTALVSAVAFILPGDVTNLLSEHAARLSANAGASVGFAGIVSFALVLFSASSGIMALNDGLNVVFERAERRSILTLRIRALVMTFVAIFFSTVTLLLLGSLQLAAFRAGMPPGIVSALRWPLTMVLAAIALASLYHYGPDRADKRWRFFTEGSLTGAVLWVAASHGLAWYLATFPGFGLTYGSLAALAGFLFWIWLSGVAVIMGAEIDALAEDD